jgi:hypothetical protein
MTAASDFSAPIPSRSNSVSGPSVKTNEPLITPKNVTVPSKKHSGEIEITDDFDDDLDDEEYYPTPLALNKTGVTGSRTSLTTNGFVSKGTLISTNKALALRKVTFPGTGSEDSRGRAAFMEEWKGKGFLFSTVPDLTYGLVQSKGGPCGLLAAVQAYILKYLLFSDKYPGALKYGAFELESYTLKLT